VAVAGSQLPGSEVTRSGRVVDSSCGACYSLVQGSWTRNMVKIDYDKLRSCDKEKLLSLEGEIERNVRRELEQKRLAEEEALRKKRKKRKRKQRRS